MLSWWWMAAACRSEWQFGRAKPWWLTLLSTSPLAAVELTGEVPEASWYRSLPWVIHFKAWMAILFFSLNPSSFSRICSFCNTMQPFQLYIWFSFYIQVVFFLFQTLFFLLHLFCLFLLKPQWSLAGLLFICLEQQLILSTPILLHFIFWSFSLAGLLCILVYFQKCVPFL